MLIPDKFYRLLIGLSFAGLAAIASIKISYTGNIFALFFCISLPLMMMLFLKPDLTIFFAIMLHASMATLPMIPQSLNLSRMFIFIFLTGTIALQLMNHSTKDRKEEPRAEIPPLFYAGVVTAMLFIHGFGMKSLGSQMQGGGTAIAQLLLVALFLIRKKIHLTKKQLSTGIILMSIASSAPMVADTIFVLSGGRTSFQFWLIEPLINALRSGMNQSGAGWRLQRASFFAPYIIELALLLKYSKIIKNGTFVGLSLLSLLILGMSGHRGTAIEILAFVASFMLLWSRKGRIKTIAFICLGLFLAYFLLWISTPSLPIAFQRVVSFIPGLHISEVASTNASDTLEWRLEFWAYILQNWREYFWLGAGFLHDPILVESLETRSLVYKMYYGINLPDHAYGMAVKDYHNGPIALLADMGIFGLTAGICLIFYILKNQIYTHTRTIFVDSGMKALHTLLVAKLCTETFVFFFVFGDVRSMLEILFLGSIAAAIVNCNARQQVTETTNGTNTGGGLAT